MTNTTQTPINPYLKACALLGVTPRPEMEDKSDPDEVSWDAFHRLTICIRAKNMINGKVWKPKYDGGETHYFPRFEWNAAFEFAYTNCDFWNTLTYVGERLEYRSYALMIEGVEEFKEYYAAYHTPYKEAA